MADERRAGGGPVFSRRGFLVGSAGAALGLAGLGGSGAFAAEPQRTRYLLSGCFDSTVGSFQISGLDLVEQKRFDLPVEHRGHGLCLHPTKPGHALVFAQRPGTVSYEFDYVNGKLTNEFRTGPGRHFYGHGIGVAGQHVLCTENSYVDGSGVVAIRDPDSYEIQGEFPSYGAGPHDMRFLDGGRILAVANGGSTRDEKGNRLSKVPATLSLIETATGKLVEKTEFPGMSLKHMHATPAGNLALALRGEADALVMIRHSSGKLVRAQDPGGFFEHMTYHTLSIRACDRTGLVACSSHRAGVVGFWDMHTGELRHAERILRANGIAISHDQRHFFVTTRDEGSLTDSITTSTAQFKPGNGRVIAVDTATGQPTNFRFPEKPGSLWLSHAVGVVA